jgi:hypothetical protein
VAVPWQEALGYSPPPAAGLWAACIICCELGTQGSKRSTWQAALGHSPPPVAGLSQHALYVWCLEALNSSGSLAGGLWGIPHHLYQGWIQCAPCLQL